MPGVSIHPLRHFGKSLIFLPLNFLVSVLVAYVRGRQRKRRTHGHKKLSQSSVFT
jgi:hypothetical protein